jgi:hypothetical protein
MKGLFTTALLSVGLALAAAAPASAEPGFGRDGGFRGDVHERGFRDGPRGDFRDGPRGDFHDAGHRRGHHWNRHHWRRACHWERVCWRGRWGVRQCRMERVCRPRWR